MSWHLVWLLSNQVYTDRCPNEHTKIANMAFINPDELKVNQHYIMVDSDSDLEYMVRYLGRIAPDKWVFRFYEGTEKEDLCDIDSYALQCKFFIKDLAPPIMDKRIIIRISSQDQQKLEIAARIEGTPTAEFIRRASLKAAAERLQAIKAV